MDLTTIWKGALLGFSIAAPVGPIGVLCIRRSLGVGFAAGFVSGLGAATADALYGAVAGLGVTSVSSWLLGARGWLRLIGGALLLGLGARTFLASAAAVQAAKARSSAGARAAPEPGVAPAVDPAPAGAPFSGSAPAAAGGGLVGYYASTLALTITNPSTILSFTAAFGALGVVTGLAAGSLVAGVFLGSAAWWLLLAGATSRLRSRLPPTAPTWINRLSGLIIGGFGLVALAAAFHS